MSRFFLDDPEPPPRRWIPWAWLGASLAVVGATTSAIVFAGGSSPKAEPRPLPVLTTPPACNLERGVLLRGLGAPFWAWQSHHATTFDVVAGGGTRWDPDPRLPRFRGHEGATYNFTRYDPCNGITSTYIELPKAVSERAALRRALTELPPDARVASRQPTSACLKLRVTSRTFLASLKARDPNFPDSTGAIVQLIFARPGETQAINAIWLDLDQGLNRKRAPSCHFRPV